MPGPGQPAPFGSLKKGCRKKDAKIIDQKRCKNELSVREGKAHERSHKK